MSSTCWKACAEVHSTLTEGVQGVAPQKLGAVLFRAFDADRPRDAPSRHALHDVDEVLLGRADAHSAQLDARALKLGIADRWMSTAHAKLTRVLKAWVLEDTRSKNGVRHNGAAVQRVELRDGDVFELGRTWFVFKAQQPVPHAPPGPSTISPALEARLAELFAIARSTVSVALSGPTGAGKEVIAREVHARSGRSGAFIAVNCGALPSELVESELFGHRKGAFSGALDDRPGLIRAAHGGTLLLDEVGDLPLEAQPALLRVLQEKTVVPVGATAPIPVDVRVVSATHRSLEQLVARGEFRDDLRARLGGYELTLPALVDRREDLGLLISALLARHAKAPVRFSVNAARALFAWDWPRNVRELEKVLERALALATAGTIELEHLPPELSSPPPTRRPSDDELDDARKRELERLLTEHHGNISAVARAMGKARMQIQRWLKRYGLDARDF